MPSADLLFDTRGPDIRRRTGLTAPDRFAYLRTADGEDTVFFDAREYDVQRRRLEEQGSSVRIERLEPYLTEARSMKDSGFSAEERTLLCVLRAKGVDVVRVSPEFGHGLAMALREGGIAVELHDFSAEGRVKTEAQIALMADAQRVTEGAYDLAVAVLRESVIADDRLLYRGETLTSEKLRAMLMMYFLERGYSCPEGMVVASGEQTACPHDDGSGPIRPNAFIILDIFPRCDATGYYADMTRTFVKGEAAPEMLRLYDAVRGVQEAMLAFAQAGIGCDAVYEATVAAFAARGFETSAERGFMHRTGHGLGLSVHEWPSLGTGFPQPLAAGMAVTVEPGLYYPGLGGARIEDVIVFHHDGRKENLTRYSKDLIIP